MEKKILVVDDDSELLEVLALILSEENYIVSTAQDPRQVLNAVEKENFDVVLCDFEMPRKNGIDVLCEVRAAGYHDLPFLILSGCSDFEIAVQAMRMGALDFIGKPAEVSTLNICVAAAIESGRRKTAENTSKADVEFEAKGGSARDFYDRKKKQMQKLKVSCAERLKETA